MLKCIDFKNVSLLFIIVNDPSISD